MELCIYVDTASEVLRKYEHEFFRVVNPIHRLHCLERKHVITDTLRTEIERADSETAKELLFKHMVYHANVAALREYCNIAVEAHSYPMMQHLGRNMLSELQPEGLSELCVHAACVFVLWCHQNSRHVGRHKPVRVKKQAQRLAVGDPQ